MGKKQDLSKRRMEALRRGDLETADKLLRELMPRQRRDREAHELEKVVLRAKRSQRLRDRNTYSVEAGDSFFSVAGDVLGDMRLAGALIEANPNVYVLHPGMEINLPDGDTETEEPALFSEEAYQDALISQELVDAIGGDPSGARVGDEEVEIEADKEFVQESQEALVGLGMTEDALAEAVVDLLINLGYANEVEPKSREVLTGRDEGDLDLETIERQDHETEETFGADVRFEDGPGQDDPPPTPDVGGKHGGAKRDGLDGVKPGEEIEPAVVPTEEVEPTEVVPESEHLFVNEELEEWKTNATEADTTLEDYVRSDLQLDDYVIDSMLGVGLAETRQVGPLAVLLTGQSMYNRVLVDYYWVDIEDAKRGYTDIGGYGINLHEYATDALIGNTVQNSEHPYLGIKINDADLETDEFKKLAEATEDGMWRLLAGYEIGDPTYFLRDTDSEFYKYYNEYRDFLIDEHGFREEDVPTYTIALSFIEKSYEYKNVYEANGQHDDEPADSQLPYFWLQPGTENTEGSLVQYQELLKKDAENFGDDALLLSEGKISVERYFDDVIARGGTIEILAGNLNTTEEVFIGLADEDNTSLLSQWLYNYVDKLELASESFIGFPGVNNVFVTHAGVPPYLDDGHDDIADDN